MKLTLKLWQKSSNPGYNTSENMKPLFAFLNSPLREIFSQVYTLQTELIDLKSGEDIQNF